MRDLVVCVRFIAIKVKAAVTRIAVYVTPNAMINMILVDFRLSQRVNKRSVVYAGEELESF